MQNNNEELFKAFIDSDQFKWYSGEIKELADDYRASAEDINLSNDQKMWYLTKAQAYEEILKLPNEWLKKD